MTYNDFQLFWCDESAGAQSCFGFTISGENTVWLLTVQDVRQAHRLACDDTHLSRDAITDPQNLTNVML